ncbi:MAG: site-specific DNA-methyltransferase, partial [Anaerolineae bacterium]|nr:site-specific DNA-methyltransferase [Anaerolineae bacterium]
WLVRNNGYKDYDDHMPEDRYQQWQLDVLDELYRITKPGGSLFYNHKLRWIDGVLLHPIGWLTRSHWTIRQEIIWDRGLAANMRGWRFWQVDERVYWLFKPRNNHSVGKELESRHAKLSSIWRLRPAPRIDEHPAPFPIEIPTRAIYSMVGEEQKVVLDPFCGTGTTLVAAKLLGNRFIGIDVSPDYVQYALRRLEDFEKERSQVQDEISRHRIEDTFAERKKRGTVTWPYGPKPSSRSETDDSK